MRLSSFGFMMAVLVLAGCASSGATTRRPISAPMSDPRSTGSIATARPPEVFLRGASRKQGFDAMASLTTGSGWRVSAANDYQVTFENQVPLGVALLSAGLLGDGKRPVYRIVAQGAETDSGTILTAEAELVTHPGTGREMVSSMKDAKTRTELQSVLDATRRLVEGRRRPAPEQR